MKEMIGHGINAITLRQIRYLTATVHSGSFAAAARRLHISQPAVFAQIKQLEDLLDIPLLVRHPRGIELTRAGKAFLEHAQVALSELDHAARAAAETIRPVSIGEVMLGMTPSAGKALFVDVLREVQANAPGLRLLLREGLTDDLWNLVTRGELAAAFCYDAKPAGSVRIRPLYEEDLHLVGTPEVMAQHTGVVAMQTLKDLKLVLGYRDHQTRGFIEQTCLEAGVDVSLSLEVEPIAMKREMLLHHGYCSIVPYGLFWDDIRSGALCVRRIEPRLSRTVSLVIHQDAPASMEKILLPIIEAHIGRVIQDQLLGWRCPVSAVGSRTVESRSLPRDERRDEIKNVA